MKTNLNYIYIEACLGSGWLPWCPEIPRVFSYLAAATCWNASQSCKCDGAHIEYFYEFKFVM